MKERPILFSAPMVRAIQEGRKTQTRRIVKPIPSDTFLPQIGEYQRTLTDRKDGEQFPDPVVRFGASDENEDYPCPYGRPGDFLWVKETFTTDYIGPRNCIIYRADEPQIKCRWKPSIFCSRKISRITLEITKVRVERLQNISEEDAYAEGASDKPLHTYQEWAWGWHRSCYEGLWGRINGYDSWNQNPWVWVVEFRRVKP